MTQIQSGTLKYSHTIGRSDFSGPAFRDPVSIAVSFNGLIYVVSHSYEFRPDGKRITMFNIEEDYLGQFGHGGEGDGEFVWPSALAVDSEQRVYLADQYLNRITVYDPEGKFLSKWGTHGSKDGELDRPSGLAFNNRGNLIVVDSNNNRIQQFTKGGDFVSSFGTMGNGPGELNLPWGIDVDNEDNVYVADWRNNRIQKFDSSGVYLAAIGSQGSGDGQFNLPSDVAVDRQGNVFVSDWGNHRIQMFSGSCQHLGVYEGEATLSKWGTIKLDANSEMYPERDLDCDLEREKKFRSPIALAIDSEDRLLVLESLRHRLQVYTKW